MTSKTLTRSKRVAEKVASGMSHIEAEIAVAKEDSKAQIAKLRARQREHDARVDLAVVELLKREHADVYATLRSRAAEQLAAKANRRAQVATAPADSGADGGDHDTAESTPPSPRQWGGTGEGYAS